jgi:hypothetical protein
MNVMSSPGMWKFGMSGLQGLDWAALWPAVAGHPMFDRVAQLARMGELMVLGSVSKSKSRDSSANRWAAAKALDAKSGDIRNYELFDPATEVFAN